ncbi:RIP metalloprotease RseP [Streptococcus sp. NLN76]|uniref:RIP metalloprotease RseP n=1 Tax=Streptococcus sp. NLN76 TaxID=2822800 RepID=UPI0018A9E4AE|nr:RIP metalloprotease RseP [Streptococcus sp. NLN76]MBF8971063.1 RIP metalloprotease RseP [Streptococcus sp. NLN76]
MMGILSFLFIFAVIVIVHEYGHFLFAKRAGILVREFAVGMGPKIFSHQGKDGTLYTIRILPLGGYVRMAGWGEDRVEIPKGSLVALSLNDQGVVTRLNLSKKQLDPQAVPLQVLEYDLEEALTIKALLMDQEQSYAVDHDATIIEKDGTEVRIAPLDVQYQNASLWGRFMTNFAGPMNNFILGVVAFSLLLFLQGGAPNPNTNQVRVVESGALAKAGYSGQVTLEKIGDTTIEDYADISPAIEKATEKTKDGKVSVQVNDNSQEVQLDEIDGSYRIGVLPALDTSLTAKLTGGFTMAASAAGQIVTAIRNLIFNPNLNGLGGPVAIYQASSMAARDGWVSVLQLLGFLSINIGIFNLLPIPALDGGKILLNIIEAIRRKPVKRETETYLTLVGAGLMVLLMIAVTWNDIIRTFF